MSESKLCLKKYCDSDTDIWDNFINESINGTFLQSRRFLGYHPEGRFEDCSLMVCDTDHTAAVIPACTVYEDGKKTFFSHKGSTFGGIIISKRYYKIKYVAQIFELMEDFFKQQGFEEIYLKQTGDLFCHEDTSLLDYFLFHHGYQNFKELSIYIDLDKTCIENIYQKFNDRRKRSLKTALKYDLELRMLDDDEIMDFHSILTENLLKYDVKPIHTTDELRLLKNTLPENISFYGVFSEGVMVAACLCFGFDGVVFHTQNLCMEYGYKHKRVMDFLMYSLIETALEKKYSIFSFGISTENMGRTLNFSLAEFKEGFAGKYRCNVIYKKCQGIFQEEVSI